MANATVVSSWSDANSAYMAVMVVEAGGKNTEYIGSVLLDATFLSLNAAGKKAALVAACKAVRDAQQVAKVDLAMTGSVTV